jgi:hypothetical protein
MNDHVNPISTGGFQIYRGKLDFTLRIPADALPCVLQMMIAKRYSFAVIEAERPHRGDCRVVFYSFRSSFDEDGLPPDE